MMGVYKILNKINNKFYIGSSKDIDKRWWRHKYSLNNDNHHSRHLQRAWNKYGEENFDFIVVEVVSSIELLFIREQYWMDKTLCYDGKYGYNVSQRAKCVYMGKGENSSMYGKHHTEETKQKLRKFHTGRKLSEETKIKMSQSSKGQIISLETRERISFMNRGKNSILNKYHIEEIKMRLANNETIVSIAKDMNILDSTICYMKNLKTWSYIRRDLNFIIFNLLEHKEKYEVNLTNKDLIIHYTYNKLESEIKVIDRLNITKIEIKDAITNYIKENDFQIFTSYKERDDSVLYLYKFDITSDIISNVLEIPINIVNAIIKIYEGKQNKPIETQIKIINTKEYYFNIAKEVMLKMYFKENKEFKEIAKFFDISYTAVFLFINKFKKKNNINYRQPKKYKNIERNHQVIELYLQKNTYKQIAEKLNITKSIVNHIIENYKKQSIMK